MSESQKQINISLCPTMFDRDEGGNRLCEFAVEDAIIKRCIALYPGCAVEFQIGNRGEEWYQSDGLADYDLENLIGEMDWSDENLYEAWSYVELARDRMFDAETAPCQKCHGKKIIPLDDYHHDNYLCDVCGGTGVEVISRVSQQPKGN